MYDNGSLCRIGPSMIHKIMINMSEVEVMTTEVLKGHVL